MMKITNDRNLEVIESSDFITDTLGIVVKDFETTGKNTLCLFIPRLMMGLDIKSGASENVVTIGKSKIKNSQEMMIGDMTANWQNYVEVPCLQIPNIQLPRYNIGERVYVTFADQDISSIAFLPYSVTDIKKRPVDIVDFGVSARAQDTDPLDDDHFYRLRFDSKTDQKIELVLTKANGEVDMYHLTLDGKNGKITLGDTDRTMLMDTNEDMFQFENHHGSVWKMKEGKVTVDCDDIEYNATNSIKFKAPTVRLEGDDLQVKFTNSITEEAQSKTERGQTLDYQWRDITAQGTRSTRNYQTDIQQASVFTIEGIAAVGGVGWMAPGGIRPPAPAAAIDSVGMANFAFPNPIGMGLAKAQPTIQTMVFLATQVDILFGMFGCPPLANTSVMVMGNLITSPFVKG
jgi:hypothetical protein